MPIAVYVSRESGRVDRVIDIERALENARGHAAVVRVFDDMFDMDAQERMVRDVKDAALDSVVLAGHSVECYLKSLSGQYLKQLFSEAGVNPNRIIAANIIEQVAAVHGDDPEGATRKARALIDVACLRATGADPVEGIEVEPRRSVLILGATTEGLVAAERLLELGYNVVIADREYGLQRMKSASRMRATLAHVAGHPSAEFVEQARLADGEGWLGDYAITLSSPEGDLTYRVGGILLARPDQRAWIEELRGHFRVDIDEDGNARSIDPSSHPAETVDPGIMVVPMRASHGRLAEKVSAADAAAMALVLKLSQPRTVHYVDVSQVDTTLCGGCASCVKTCAFGACYIDEEGFSQVDVRRCRGCGKCVVSCPVGARDIVNSPHDYLLDAIHTLAEVDAPDKVIGFLCGGCGYPAADSAASLGTCGTYEGNGEYRTESDGDAAPAADAVTYPASFLPVRIPCGGRLDTLYVLEAFKSGFDGVAVFRCREGHCHNLIGNLDMDRRINLLRTVLRSRNLDDARLRIIDISPFEGERFVEQVNEVFDTVRGLDEAKGGPR